MSKLIPKLIIYFLAITVSVYLLPGIHISDTMSLVMVTLVLVALRAVVKPILLLLTLPFTVVTLGLFVFVVNGVIVLMADSLVSGFKVDGLIWAMIFSLVLSIFTSIFESLDKDSSKKKKSSKKPKSRKSSDGGKREVGDIGV